MTRIQPIDPAAATGPVKDTFDSIQRTLGGVPGMFRTLGHAPAALAALWGVFGAMGRSSLPNALREQIALRVGEVNHCDYCVAAHTALARHAKLTDAEALAARRGSASDPKSAAALVFVDALLSKQAHVSDEDLAAVRRAGFGDGEILDLVGVVVQNIFTNWVNHVAQPAIDFPAAPALK